MPRYNLRSSYRLRDGRAGSSFRSEAIEAADDAAAIVVAELNANCPAHMQRHAALLLTTGGAVVWSAKGLPASERAYATTTIGVLQA